MKIKFLRLIEHCPRRAQAFVLSSLLFLLGAVPSSIGDVAPIPRFQILIDTNQMNLADINEIHNWTYDPLAVDGVWGVTQNNCGLHCPPIPDGFSQTNPDVPPSEWPVILLGLNAVKWTITEDEAIHGSFCNPPVQQINNNDFAAVSSYIGRTANESLAFWEYFPLPAPKCPQPPDCTECINGIISPAEIENLANSGIFRGKISFLTRGFDGDVNDPHSDAYWVQAGLNDSLSSGLVFETNPGAVPTGQNSSVAGLTACLNSGKKCYLLLAPNWSPPGTTYDQDAEDAVEYLRNEGIPLTNPNLFVVLAVYGRAETHVGFMTGENNTGFNNSVWAAALKLQNYRNSKLPQATKGALLSVDFFNATGWAVDPETFSGYSQSIYVDLYVNGPHPGSGILVSHTLANIPRSDVNAAGYLGNHGFQIPIPAQYKDGLPHSWYAYGMSASNDPAKNSLLSGSPKTVTLDGIPPVVAITAPPNNIYVRGTVTVSGTASDNVHVQGVQFKVDNSAFGNELLNPAASFSVPWDTTVSGTGPHALKWTARDNSPTGNPTDSATRTVTVDNTPPTVVITAPANGAGVSRTVTISATATDANPLAGVQFNIDNQDFLTMDRTFPYAVSWNTTTYANGSHTLKATAQDAAGNTMTSATVTVIVSNSSDH